MTADALDGGDLPSTEALLREAAGLSEMGRHDRAIALLRAVDADHPENAAVEATLAVALLRRGEPAAALAGLDKALTAHPADAELGRLRGAALIELGRAAEAVSALSTVSDRSPSATVLAQLALAELRSGEVEIASSHAEAAVALDRTSQSALLAAGVCGLAAGRWQDAERRLRALLLHEPSAAALNNLGIARLHQGDRNEGLRHLREARTRSEVTPLANRAVVGNLRAVDGEVPLRAVLIDVPGLRRINGLIVLLLIGLVALARQPGVLVAGALVVVALLGLRAVGVWRRPRRLIALPLSSGVTTPAPPRARGSRH